MVKYVCVCLPWSQLREFSVFRGVPDPRLLYMVGSFPWKLLTVAVYSSPPAIQQNILFCNKIIMFTEHCQDYIEVEHGAITGRFVLKKKEKKCKM